MKALMVILPFLLIAACGKNPHVVAKKKNLEVQAPLVQALVASPELVLREKGTGKEGLLDLGSVKTGESASINLELINLGKSRALNILIPKKIGKFTLENINCDTDLNSEEACELKGIYSGQEEKVDQEKVTISYSSDKQSSETSIYLLAATRNPAPVKEDEPILTITPKNFPSGPVLMKDVSVNDVVQIQLEILSVGKVAATDVTLPDLAAPFRLKSQDCPKTLEPGSFCSVFLEYAPVAEGQGQLDYSVDYSGKKASQIITGTSKIYEEAGKLEVVDGTINIEIYEILQIKPEELSPLQEVRGIDLGVLAVNKEKIFRIEIKNAGAYEAVVTQLKGFQSPLFSFTGGSFPGTGGTCGMTFKKGSCFLEIKVVPNELKNIHDLIEFTYSDGRHQTRRLSLLIFASVKEERMYHCRTIEARSSSGQIVAQNALSAQGLYRLPYKSRSPRASLSTLMNIASNQNLRFTKNGESLVVPSIHNAMIQFGFDISKEELAKYKSVRLELDILKVSTEGSKFDTTEVLCLNENRRCSGTFFIDSNFSTLNSTNYMIQSNYFSLELARSTPENLSSLRTLLAGRGLVASGEARNSSLFRLKKQFPLSSLFGDFKTANLPHGLNLILADDSLLLTQPKLILESDVEGCEK